MISPQPLLLSMTDYCVCYFSYTGRTRDDILVEADRALTFFKEEFGFHFSNVSDDVKLGNIHYIQFYFIITDKYIK